LNPLHHPTSIAIADAKFGNNIDDAAISTTSSFFFIYQSFEALKYIYQPSISQQQPYQPGQVVHPGKFKSPGLISTLIADAKFGINVGITAIRSTSSFFFIFFSFVING